MTIITSYVTGDEFLTRYDARLIGDLVRDDGTTEPPESLADNLNLQTALSDAYGAIVSAIAVGDRYTLAQIDPDNLSATGLSVLKRLNSQLALVYIKQRRGRLDGEKDKTLIEETNAAIKGLKDGEAILLGVDDANAQASVIGLGQPELIPISQRNSIRFNTRNYYPIYPYSGKQRPYGTGGN